MNVARSLRPVRQIFDLRHFHMYNVQFHKDPTKIGCETFPKASMTEPDNAMSIPEIIARYTRGHGIQVPVLPFDPGFNEALEDGSRWDDDPDMLDPFGLPPVDQKEASKAPAVLPPADQREASKAAADPASLEAGQE